MYPVIPTADDAFCNTVRTAASDPEHREEEEVHSRSREPREAASGTLRHAADTDFSTSSLVTIQDAAYAPTATDDSAPVPTFPNARQATASILNSLVFSPPLYEYLFMLTSISLYANMFDLIMINKSTMLS